MAPFDMWKNRSPAKALRGPAEIPRAAQRRSPDDNALALYLQVCPKKTSLLLRSGEATTAILLHRAGEL